MEKPIDFLKRIYNTECDNFAVNYKPYEYGTLVETIGTDEAVRRINEDIKDLQSFMNGAKGIEADKIKEYAVKGTYRIWERQLVVYR